MAVTGIRYVFMVVSPMMDRALEAWIPLAGDEHEVTQYNRGSYETVVKHFKLTQETVDRYIALIGKYGIEDQAGNIKAEPAVFEDGHSHTVSFLTLRYDDGSEKKMVFRETDASCKEAAEAFRRLFFTVTSEENLISETLEYPTLKQCREMREEHGPVVAVETCFSSSGMMYGSNQSVVQLVERLEGGDGMVRVTVRKKAGNEPEASDSRELRSDILAKVQEISDRENLPCWCYACIDPSIPVDRSMMPLDYSSHGCINIYYDDSQITGCRRVKRTIGESACKMGGKEIDSLLSGLVCDCVCESGVDVKMPEVKLQVFSAMGMGQDPSTVNMFEGFGMAQKAAAGTQGVQPKAVGTQGVQPAADGTWICGECGHSGNTGKFCPNCGSARR